VALASLDQLPVPNPALELLPNWTMKMMTKSYRNYWMILALLLPGMVTPRPRGLSVADPLPHSLQNAHRFQPRLRLLLQSVIKKILA